jgi:predicted nucleic acid-binding protein
MTGDRVFVDTNILLRIMLPEMRLHQEAEALIQEMWADEAEPWISRQIIREFIVQATHPNTFAPPLAIEAVLKQIDTLASLFNIADDTAEVTGRLLDLLREFPTRGKQIHDANIVATMLVHGIDTLATLNISDMKRFQSRIKLITPDQETQ